MRPLPQLPDAAVGRPLTVGDALVAARADDPVNPQTSPMRRDGDWYVPLTDLTLPSPIRALREGQQLLTFHPRNPYLRMTGETARPHEDGTPTP
jgi:hypothetical protein